MRKLKADENDIFNGECWPSRGPTEVNVTEYL